MIATKRAARSERGGVPIPLVVLAVLFVQISPRKRANDRYKESGEVREGALPPRLVVLLLQMSPQIRIRPRDCPSELQNTASWQVVTLGFAELGLDAARN